MADGSIDVGVQEIVRVDRDQIAVGGGQRDELGYGGLVFRGELLHLFDRWGFQAGLAVVLDQLREQLALVLRQLGSVALERNTLVRQADLARPAQVGQRQVEHDLLHIVESLANLLPVNGNSQRILLVKLFQRGFDPLTQLVQHVAVKTQRAAWETRPLHRARSVPATRRTRRERFQSRRSARKSSGCQLCSPPGRSPAK